MPTIYNHFEYLKGLCTKSGLIRSLTEYYDLNREARAAKYTVFDTTPTTFLIDMTYMTRWDKSVK